MNSNSLHCSCHSFWAGTILCCGLECSW